MSEEYKGKELGWDDSVEKGSSFTVLPEGEYDFTIESFERGRYEGSDKVPACPQALLKVRVDAPEGTCIMNENYACMIVCSGSLQSSSCRSERKK